MENILAQLHVYREPRAFVEDAGLQFSMGNSTAFHALQIIPGKHLRKAVLSRRTRSPSRADPLRRKLMFVLIAVGNRHENSRGWTEKRTSERFSHASKL